MSVNIYPFFCFFALISESELEPMPCGNLRDSAFDLKCRKDHCINVHVMQDCLIVKEGVMPTLSICHWKREVSMFHEIQLCMLNLVSKVWAPAHPTCNGHARLEAWLFACLAHPVICVKFDIFSHRDEERKQLDCLLRFIPLNVLKTTVYNLHDVRWPGVLLWCEDFSRHLDCSHVRQERGLF